MGTDKPTEQAPAMLRINATLSGYYARIWREEKAKGGGDGEVLRRFMDRAKARTLQQARHDIYEQLDAIRLAGEVLRVEARTPEQKERAAAVAAAVDRARRLVSMINSA